MNISNLLPNRFIVLLTIALTLSITARSQIVINEISASNATQIEDQDYLDYSDWIELYNTGTNSINIKGYYITDDLETPDKWEITESISIAAGEHLIIWADSKESGLHTNFNLSASGEQVGLYNSNLTIQDSIEYTTQQSDISYGRESDGSSDWVYFTSATPEASNTGDSYTYLGLNTPEFSVNGGFYNTDISVEILNYLDGDIYYTLDGSEPELSSERYTKALDIRATTILRARIFKDNYVPGIVSTASYFINENSVQEALPVVSIATNPENFWDEEVGIYVQDYKPEWEIPINIELFENDNSNRAAFNELAGTKVNGLYSWQLPQKMLGIYFRNQYGSSNLDYALMNQRKRSEYKNFSLRASGNDWSNTLFRDILGQQASLLNTQVDIMAYKPAIVYVNGQYMGIHNIREKVDDNYIEQSYGYDSDSFDMIENGTTAENGDLTAYNEYLALLDKDLSNDANYEAVAEVIDIENFTDYIITEMYASNTSIDHNIMAWKPKDSGQWKWILMDLDRGFSDASDDLINDYVREENLPLNDLLDNDDYALYFGERLSAHLYTSFHPDRIKELIAERQQAIEAEMPNHIDRWEGTTSSYGDAIPSFDYWLEEIDEIKEFAEERPSALLEDLQDYGFSSTATLGLSTYPEDAATLSIAGLNIPESSWVGPYLTNITSTISQKENPGYTFNGWASVSEQILIASGDTWYYSDAGTDLGNAWTDLDYDMTTWKQGISEFGYGDDDEATEVDYGNDSSDKNITTYFRKLFSLTQEDIEGSQYNIRLLKDDGAIVYLNGYELIRDNMDDGDVDYQTTAASTISGSDESSFTSYSIDKDFLMLGENIIAVEVHQNAANSSDMSFDLELSGYIPNIEDYISTSSDYEITLTDNTYLIAVYSTTDQCLIPTQISEDLNLSIDCSPYYAQGDISIDSGATLTIEAGVDIYMPTDANIYVSGVLNALGTADNGINFSLAPDAEQSSWGVISFKNTDTLSSFSYVTIEETSVGENLALETGAISAFNADLILDNVTIDNIFGNPIMARYSNITLTNSKLHCDVTGDLINVKYGQAYIENCEFTGNEQEDADAIDYDDIENGVIRNCTISNFYGYNSDAIDIGEKASNILIDSVIIANITDKGISLGQQSSATIQNCTFINCNQGITVKDTSTAHINSCVFYGNVDAVMCYEKNLGYAGGNAIITNSILSNYSDSAFYIDSKSTLSSNYCLSDVLEDHSSLTNIAGNPLFESPSFHNFNLSSTSPAIGTGLQHQSSINMGTPSNAFYFQPSVMIYQFYINADKSDLPEFIALYNPSEEGIDISNYTITDGISATVPEGTYLDAYEILYLTSDATANRWWLNTEQIINWEDGKLANDGESVKLQNNYGMLIDFFNYSNDGIWPVKGFTSNNVFQLIDPALDNHFGESWEIVEAGEIMDTSESTTSESFIIYPNPTQGSINIKALNYEDYPVYVYDIAGRLMLTGQLDNVGLGTLDLSGIPKGMYIIRISNTSQKAILID